MSCLVGSLGYFQSKLPKTSKEESLEPPCSQGYSAYRDACIDYDECVNQKHSCHAKAKCINTQGSFSCYCREGYYGDGENCLVGSCFDNVKCQPRKRLDYTRELPINFLTKRNCT